MPTPPRSASCSLLLTASLLACGVGDTGSMTDGSTGPGSSSGTSGDPTSSSSTGEPTSTGSTGEPTSSSSAGSTGSTGEPTTGGSSSTGPDPDHVRECQPGDFVCDDWGCEQPPVVRLGECYKPCTPDAIGEPDAECDEPERPFCSEIGRALGGDFDCNDCAHVCVSASIDQCGQGVDGCSIP